jgi:glycine cleavage system H protein
MDSNFANRIESPKCKRNRGKNPQRRLHAMADIKGYNMPDELYYHKDHSWARVDGSKVTVGMNDFFQQEAGDIVFVDLPEEEDDVSQGETCGKIQSRKWIGKLVAPVSGEIVEINEDLEEDTSLINTDPYGKGWILVIEASDLDSELGNLMQGEALVGFIEQEIKIAEEEKAKA